MLTKWVFAKVISDSESMFSLEIDAGEGNITTYRDITRDIGEIERLADLINSGNVSPVHIKEIIEDFLP